MNQVETSVRAWATQACWILGSITQEQTPPAWLTLPQEDHVLGQRGAQQLHVHTSLVIQLHTAAHLPAVLPSDVATAILSESNSKPIVWSNTGKWWELCLYNFRWHENQNTPEWLKTGFIVRGWNNSFYKITLLSFGFGHLSCIPCRWTLSSKPSSVAPLQVLFSVLR